MIKAFYRFAAVTVHHNTPRHYTCYLFYADQWFEFDSVKNAGRPQLRTRRHVSLFEEAFKEGSKRSNEMLAFFCKVN